jgi:hypothetical protein
MNHKSAIAIALILGGVSAAGYFLGAISKNEEFRTLEAKAKRLENLNKEQSDLLADPYGMSWETLEKKDPIIRKHMIMQTWYGSQDAGNYFLGRDTGHEWGPRWNRRSPLLILEEQTEVMREFLKDLRKLEEASPYPPKYPTEDHRDPADGSRVDWENFIEVGNQENSRAIWYGKSRGRGNWMAYEYEKGVYTPDSELLQNIVDHKKTEDDEADPFSGGE